MANPTFAMVSLELHGVGKYRQINSVVDASRCLLEYWPKEKQQGVAFVMALLACQAAIDGRGSAQAAREALIAAANEADIFFMEE
jgi:hypothetical protein